MWSEQQTEIFDWFKTPNPEEPYLVVVARAGTGKTTTIIEGVKRAPESRILICAFSKIIQQELEFRIGRDHTNVKAQTLHSLGLSCIRKFRDNIKIDFSSQRADSLTEAVCGVSVPDTIKKLVTKLHTKGREIAPHARHVGELTNIAITFDCEPEAEWVVAGFDAEFVEQKALQAMELASQIKSNETIDGSDMIFLPVRNRWLTKQFDLVVVDEAQDMTTAQLEIGQGVLRDGGRICIVGDNRQAIFGFRGADSESLERLREELDAKVLNLTKTYRCGQKIVELAQRLVPDYEAGPDNPMGEILEIPTAKVVELAGPSDFILSRVNAPLVSMALQLLRSGKRTRVAGKDIGKGLVTLVRKFKASSVPDFLRKVEMWRNKEQTRIDAELSKAQNGRKATLLNKSEEVDDKADMLIEFAAGAKNINEVTERITALFEDDGLGAAGMITCSSVHKAKGLEANRVFVLMDTIRNYNQEEQNIEYVALTRAKTTLVLVSDRG